MRVTNLRLKACVCGVLAAVSGAAIAQEKMTVLEEIVVTAQKRSESLQDVPISIAAFTENTRILIGVNTVQDVTDFTPGITYQTSLDRMMVRGVGRLTNNLATDPGVATYVNGVFSASNWSGGLSPLFIDRLEILRGPQGTLYGRNSIGGAMNVVGKRPTNEWSGEVRAQFENYNRRVVEGRVAGPITDWLRASVGGNSIEQKKGYFNNINGGPGEGGVASDDYREMQVAMNIGDLVDIWAEYTHWDIERSDRTSAVVNSGGTYDPALFPPAALVPSVNYCATGTTCARRPAMSNIRQFATGTPNAISDPVDTYMLEAIAHFGFADLKYIGGYTNYRYDALSDTAGTARTSNVYTPTVGTPFTIAGGGQFHYLEDKRYYSNELNLLSTGDGALRWIAGLYQYTEKYDQFFSFNGPQQPQLAGQFVLAGQTGGGAAGAYVPNPNYEIYRNETWNKTRSNAVFGQLDWQMASMLKGTLGLRYTEDEKNATEELHAVSLGTPLFAGFFGPLTGTSIPYSIGQFLAAPGQGYLGSCAGCLDRDIVGRWHATTGTAGLEWTPSDDTLAYFKFTRGYKSGGFNSGAIVAVPKTGAEQIDAFELGLKQNITNDFQINSSVFFYNYKDAQAPLTVVTPGSPNSTIYVNIPSVHNWGGDVSATWNATSQLQILLTYGYLKSSIEEGCCYSDPTDATATRPGAKPSGTAPGAQTLVGESMPGSPNHQGSVAANYRFDFNTGSLTLVGTYAFRSEQYFSIFNREYNRGGGYGTTGLRSLWVDADNRYSIIAYVKNAFNKVATDNVAGALASNDINETLTLIPPRTYGFEFQYRFGAGVK